ncbi:MAG: deoxyribose-phosphate aldolase [Tissierella sp.]|uniref:deoxyribose-phosphate aldolase n=1 Tax=Tissierella sp. TaxID=41274 RepID=UPI003F960BAB
MDNIALMIDHTLLKPEATRAEIKNLCSEAKKYKFKAVCINPFYVKYCKDLLKDTDVKIATVIGFPLGANTTEAKVFETKNAITNGADEIDMVINIGSLKNKDFDIVKKDIEEVVGAAGKNKLVKVIIETSLLNHEEKIKACQLSKKAGADFVKTSTGFSSGGATSEDVKLMKSIVEDKLEVKASGGVRDIESAKNMIENGATRLGTSSGVKIIKELLNKK